MDLGPALRQLPEPPFPSQLFHIRTTIKKPINDREILASGKVRIIMNLTSLPVIEASPD